MLRLIFILSAISLGSWAQSASACLETNVAPDRDQTAIEVIASLTAEEFAVPGREQRCECPAMQQDAQAIASEFGKTLFVPGNGRTSASLNSIDVVSVALAAYSRASSFTSRRSEQPPYLLTPRLRQ
jgi:hypothetical protein